MLRMNVLVSSNEFGVVDELLPFTATFSWTCTSDESFFYLSHLNVIYLYVHKRNQAKTNEKKEKKEKKK